MDSFCNPSVPFVINCLHRCFCPHLVFSVPSCALIYRLSSLKSSFENFVTLIVIGYCSLDPFFVRHMSASPFLMGCVLLLVFLCLLACHYRFCNWLFFTLRYHLFLFGIHLHFVWPYVESFPVQSILRELTFIGISFAILFTVWVFVNVFIIFFTITWLLSSYGPFHASHNYHLFPISSLACYWVLSDKYFRLTLCIQNVFIALVITPRFLSYSSMLSGCYRVYHHDKFHALHTIASFVIKFGFYVFLFLRFSMFFLVFAVCLFRLHALSGTRHKTAGKGMSMDAVRRLDSVVSGSIALPPYDLFDVRSFANVTHDAVNGIFLALLRFLSSFNWLVVFVIIYKSVSMHSFRV